MFNDGGVPLTVRPSAISTLVATAREQPALAEKHILLVDDERDILDLLTEVFLGNGYSVDSAVTVAEGIALLDRCSYELVISDWRLPDGDGLMVADTAAAIGAKTILMSGHLSQMKGGR